MRVHAAIQSDWLSSSDIVDEFGPSLFEDAKILVWDVLKVALNSIDPLLIGTCLKGMKYLKNASKRLKISDPKLLDDMFVRMEFRQNLVQLRRAIKNYQGF